MEKKRITITIVCDTKVEDTFIEKHIKRGVYFALDREPYYIAPPSQVQTVEVLVEDVKPVESFESYSDVTDAVRNDEIENDCDFTVEGITYTFFYDRFLGMCDDYGKNEVMEHINDFRHMDANGLFERK